MNPEGVITIKGKNYPVCFSTNGMNALDMYLKKESLPRVSQFLQRLTPDVDPISKKIIRMPDLDLAEMLQLLFAMLEGGRRRIGVPTREAPYTMDEVGNLVDINDMPRIFTELSAILRPAMPETKETTGVAGAGAPKNVRPTRSGTGKVSSRRR